MSADTQTLTVPAEHLEAVRAGVLLSMARNAESAARNTREDTRELPDDVLDLNQGFALFRQVENAAETTAVKASSETLWGVLEDAVRGLIARIAKAGQYSPPDVDDLRPANESLTWALEQRANAETHALAERA